MIVGMLLCLENGDVVLVLVEKGEFGDDDNGKTLPDWYPGVHNVAEAIKMQKLFHLCYLVVPNEHHYTSTEKVATCEAEHVVEDVVVEDLANDYPENYGGKVLHVPTVLELV